ncbi:MAG: DUF3857 domain-containing protein [Candidatus Azobacteroides sp.]|nr:DUF3857 domain-containing protein [Candidatus Azobacteroides sp.]
MKNLMILLFLFFLSQLSYTQEKLKFGEISPEVLSMKTYDKDSTASAVVLYEYCDVYYDINAITSDFEIISEYTVRIKILKQEGTEFANQSIGFYKGNTGASSEAITGLTGFTYNLEGGKVVKEKLSKDYIFTEDVTEHRKRLKFAMPAVKEGSVFEYKYKKSSPYYYDPLDYKFQRSIPVKYSYFIIKIPEYFVFNRETKGYEPIKVNIEKTNQTFNFKSQIINCTAEEISAETRNLPALKDESFVWNYYDYMTGINLELKKVEFVGQYYKNYSQTWDDVVKLLEESDTFGKQLNNKNLFKDELPLALASKTEETDKIRAILDMVRNKVKWNDRATLSIENVKKALKEGVGTSGEINALLISALRDAGFDANPVVMSLRSRGRIPMTYPSIDNLNYFIVCVTSGENKYYLDGRLRYTDINVIPVDCMVDKAMSIQSGRFNWVDLTNIGKNSSIATIMASFDENGILSGNFTNTYVGEPAFLFKKAYDAAKNQDEYIEKEATDNDIAISNYSMEEKRGNSFSYVEKYSFTKNDIQLADNEFVTINPLLFMAMTTNAFKPETRKLPVEFSYPYETRVILNLNIPEGYVLDEIPKSEKYVYEDNLAALSYAIQQNGDLIQLVYRFNLNTCIVSAMNYEHLRNFWSKAYSKNNEFITLKKVSL